MQRPAIGHGQTAFSTSFSQHEANSTSVMVRSSQDQQLQQSSMMQSVSGRRWRGELVPYTRSLLTAEGISRVPHFALPPPYVLHACLHDGANFQSTLRIDRPEECGMTSATIVVLIEDRMNSSSFIRVVEYWPRSLADGTA